MRAALFALGIDLLLVGLKFAVYALSGSPAVYADGWHSAADGAISLVVLGSLLLEHRLGRRGRALLIENAVAFGVGLFIVANGVHVALAARQDVQYEPLGLYVALGGTVLTIVAAWLLARFKLAIARRYGSLSFEAEGHHSLSDMWTSVGVFVTLLLALVGVRVEGIAAVAIGALIARVGVGLVYKSVVNLRDKRGMHPEAFRDLPAWLTWAPLARGAHFLLRGLQWAGAQLQRFAWLLLVLAALAYLSTGLHVVGPGQAGLHITFGAVDGEPRGPGLHLHLPAPFGGCVVEDVSRFRLLRLGFRDDPSKAINGEGPVLWGLTTSGGRYTAVQEEGRQVTGDAYLVDVALVMGYRISDLRRYVLSAAEPEELLRAGVTAVLAERVGRAPLDGLLTGHREVLEAELVAGARARARQLDLGLEVLSAHVVEVHPPATVVPVYRGVASAREARQERVDRAEGYANDLLPRARGKAAQVLNSARTFRATQLGRAEGRAQGFAARKRAFQLYPELTRLRLGLDAAKAALARAGSVYVLPSVAQRKIVRLAGSETPASRKRSARSSPEQTGPLPEVEMPPEPSHTPTGEQRPEGEEAEDEAPDVPPEARQAVPLGGRP